VQNSKQQKFRFQTRTTCKLTIAAFNHPFEFLFFSLTFSIFREWKNCFFLFALTSSLRDYVDKKKSFSSFFHHSFQIYFFSFQIQFFIYFPSSHQPNWNSNERITSHLKCGCPLWFMFPLFPYIGKTTPSILYSSCSSGSEESVWLSLNKQASYLQTEKFLVTYMHRIGWMLTVKASYFL